jgi:hypothetical protein
MKSNRNYTEPQFEQNLCNPTQLFLYPEKKSLTTNILLRQYNVALRFQI